MVKQTTMVCRMSDCTDYDIPSATRPSVRAANDNGRDRRVVVIADLRMTPIHADEVAAIDGLLQIFHDVTP